MNELADQILNALWTGCNGKEYKEKGDYCEVESIPSDESGFRLHFGAMYESPNLGFASLKALSDLFGTEDIDVDEYRWLGCETCDYGSNYGHDIDVINPTRFVNEMNELIGQDLFELTENPEKWT